MMNAITTVDFHGDTLFAIERDEAVFVAIKPICDRIGVDWSKQLQRIKRDAVMAEGMAIMAIPSPGGPQDTTLLRLDLINGWLFGIDESRVKDEETRQRVLAYKRECYRVLFDHFFRRPAEAPARDVVLSRRPRAARKLSIAGMHARDVRAASEFVGRAMQIGGREAGLEAWLEHSGLPRLKAFERLIEHGGRWNGPAALRHLFGLPIGGGPLGELICAAVDDKVKRRDIEEYGVRILDLNEGTVLMVADDHPFLREGFADTDICYAWNDYLRKLPGACRAKKPMMIDERMRRGVLLPKEVWHD